MRLRVRLETHLCKLRVMHRSRVLSYRVRELVIDTPVGGSCRAWCGLFRDGVVFFFVSVLAETGEAYPQLPLPLSSYYILPYHICVLCVGTRIVC